MSQVDRERSLQELRKHVRSWLALWGIRGLDDRLTIEWSSRLQRSLGRAFPGRFLVRLSPLLLSARQLLVLEVLCHEIAHVVVPVLNPGRCRPHGAEWAELVRAAGFSPRIRVPVAAAFSRARTGATAAGIRHRRASGTLYVHTCPVCHVRRLARRRIPRWRCADCLAAGLDGRLTVAVIEARPS